MMIPVLEQLDAVCEARDVRLDRPLSGLVDGIDGDMRAVDDELRTIDVVNDAPAEQSVRHLLSQRGKRLRPLCVALASRTGPHGFNERSRNLAVAAELVHAATLLHDDVVDEGDVRRGVPTARKIYGNAASIFGGDWLLVEAMRRIQSTNLPQVLDHALVVLREMVEAESAQLVARGRVVADRAGYLRVANGKTASLFGWALGAGATSGGASASVVGALVAFGRKLGLAFQVVDDSLDITGSPRIIGKAALADVREGKMTFPLLVALERDPRVRPWLEQACVLESPGEVLLADIALAVRTSGAIEESRRFASEVTAEAIACLEEVPAGPAREALRRAALGLTARQS
jgi:octaprenyl-diphosphate synthase